MKFNLDKNQYKFKALIMLTWYSFKYKSNKVSPFRPPI